MTSCSEQIEMQSTKAKGTVTVSTTQQQRQEIETNQVDR